MNRYIGTDIDKFVCFRVDTELGNNIIDDVDAVVVDSNV